MEYLEIEDLQVFIQQDQLNQIIESDSTILDKSEAYALSRVRNYLSGRWDVNFEFALTGSSRNLDLVGIVSDITIYFVNKRLAHRAIPEMRQIAYDDALSWLRQVNRGELNIDIQKITPSQVVPIQYGTNPRSNNSY